MKKDKNYWADMASKKRRRIKLTKHALERIEQRFGVSPKEAIAILMKAIPTKTSLDGTWYEYEGYRFLTKKGMGSRQNVITVMRDL